MKNLRSDPRFTIGKEHTGKASAQYVVRFCGEWVSSHATESAAMMRAAGEAARRRGCAVVCAVEAKAEGNA